MGESNTNGYLLPDKAYQALKWLALIALPAVAWLVGAVGPQWGLPHCGEIVTTINAIGLFVGALAIAATGGFDGNGWGVVLAGVVGVAQVVYTAVNSALGGKLSKDKLDLAA